MKNLADTLSDLVAENGFNAVQEALSSLNLATTDDDGDPNQPPHGPGGNPPPPPPPVKQP